MPIYVKTKDGMKPLEQASVKEIRAALDQVPVAIVGCFLALGLHYCKPGFLYWWNSPCNIYRRVLGDRGADVFAYVSIVSVLIPAIAMRWNIKRKLSQATIQELAEDE